MTGALGVAAAHGAGPGHDGVRKAWPDKPSHRPETGLTRWLARQVGPTPAVPCSERPAAARAMCSHPRHGGTALDLTTTRRHPLQPTQASFAPGRAATASSAPATASATTAVAQPLQLIRSFEIPVGDPSYGRLLNLSYTYDSALAATAFATENLGEQAGRLLDQLAALQRKDGSIELAFNVATGEGSGNVSSGSVAFSAIAFSDYDNVFGKTTYLEAARKAVDYLLGLREELGLIRGGPEVKWVSTQHNILTLIALDGLIASLERRGEKTTAKRYQEAVTSLAKAIEAQLIVRGIGSSHFREGVKDEVVPLDAQTLGVAFALIRSNPALAFETYNYAQQNFAISNRSIELNKAPANYNLTYQAKGPFTGYRPYLGTGAPDVLWFEGTAQMRLVSAVLGQSTVALDASTNAWWNVTRKEGVGPLGADRTITGNAYNEYHVWPTAAAGSWTVLSRATSNLTWLYP
jgi:hypothetical protein